MKEFKAANTGNKVVINCAPIADALKLKEVLLKELIKFPLGLKLKESQTGLKEFLNKEVDFVGVTDFIKNSILSIDISEDFQEIIFKCLSYCTYKGTYRIDLELFDNKSIPEAREDYYEIILACVEENLLPFVKSLVSTWKTRTSTGLIDQLLGLL